MDYRTIYRNTLTKKCYVFVSTDHGESLRFYHLDYPLGMEDGEYEYWITDPDEPFVLNENDPRKSTLNGYPIWVYDCGMARVGAIERGQTTMYDLDKTYEQYR